MIRVIGSRGAAINRGQQLDANGNKIGQEIQFEFPEAIDTFNMDIESLQSGPDVAILVDQDLFLDRDTPFAWVFRVDSSGDAVFLPGHSEAVQGLGPALKHFDFAPANSGSNGWRSHAIGRLGPGILAQTDSIRQNFDREGSSLIKRLGRRQGSNDILESAGLANGRGVLLHDENGDTNEVGRFNVLIIASDGEVTRTVIVGNSSNVNGNDKVQGLKGGGFVVEWTERDSRDADVLFQLLTSGGAVVKANVHVGNTGVSDNKFAPAIAPLEDGGFIIFYKIRVPRGSRIRDQRHDPAANLVDDNLFVTDESAQDIDATLLANGRVAVV